MARVFKLPDERIDKAERAFEKGFGVYAWEEMKQNGLINRYDFIKLIYSINN